MQKRQTIRPGSSQRAHNRQCTAPATRLAAIRNAGCSFQRPAADVLTLAPTSALSLPSLVGARQQYTHSSDNALLLPVALRLVELGHCSRKMWTGQLDEFVRAGIDALLKANGGDATEHHVDVSASLSRPEAHSDYYAADEETNPALLLLSVSVEACGWFFLAPTINALERKAKGLGAAFYTTLETCLSWFDVYGFQRAMWARGSQLEMAECEGEAESDIEVWDPRAAAPSALHRYLDKQPMKQCTAMRLLKKHSQGKHSRIICALLELAELESCYMPHKSGPISWDTLPSWLIAFRPHDDINAAFDDYGEYATQGDLGPVWWRKFDTQKPEQIDAALDALAYTTRMYGLASRIQRAIHGESNEK